jgi:murein DD-endopeptidase MepM/ murein hydrolase activator NlpD
MIYYGHEVFKIMTQMVQELKCNIKEYSRMRTFLLSLIIFSVFLESIPAFALSNGWPVAYGSITSGIGWRKDPFGSGKLKWHNGIDIAVPLYTPVTPTGPGMIRYAGWHKDYGWLVVVDHHNGWFTMYGHNYTLAVKVGQEVTTETVISYAGSTGKSIGVHVHYEQRWYPEGATQAPVATEINNIREYSDREVQQPQGTSEQSAEEIRQSAQASGQPPEETRQPGFKSYIFTTPGGVGGE